MRSRKFASRDHFWQPLRSGESSDIFWVIEIKSRVRNPHLWTRISKYLVKVATWWKIGVQSRPRGWFMTFPLGTSTRVEITSLLRYNIHFAVATALLFDFGQPGETVRLRLFTCCILMNHYVQKWPKQKSWKIVIKNTFSSRSLICWQHFQ